jgi:serine/threonine-protein kinase
LIGKTISHYQIIEKLGVGGMGVVYKAQDLNLDRFVALKFLPPHLTTIGEEKQRFIHEAKAASALQHNNICAIHEIDETEDDQIFICMDYYQGETLNKKIKEKPLPIEEAVDVISQIAEGLLDAHEKGLVHRDIKPANIFITKDDIVKILDFGLAKSAKFTQLTKDGGTIGTVAYMSPEQTRGAQVDQRTDIWSLGVVMYEIITGELPFKGDYEQAIIYSILHEDPEPISTENSDIPPEVIRVITKALTKDPDNRYQTIGEFLSDLKNFASPEYESLSFGSSKISKKHYPRWLFFVSGAFIILLASILYFINPFGSDSRRLESIVVLPFENYTGNDELEYFVAGMHSSLIGDIGKISALRVISKTTSNAYKNVEKSIPEIASELGVDAVIEAFVLSLGDSVRLQVKLVDVFPEEQQLWVQDYYEEKSQILTLYNKVTKEISEEINIVLTPQEQNLLTEAKTVNTEAYDAYLKGHIYWEQLSENSLNRALEYFNLAIDKDPEWAPLYAGLAKVWVGLVQMGHVSPEIAIPKIYENLNKALELDPNYAGSHFTNGIVAVWTEWDWEKGEKEFLTALKLNPNDVMSRIYYAHLLMILGRIDEALSQGQIALDLDPLNPLIQTLFAVVLIDVGDYQSAIVHSEKALLADPGNFIAAWILEQAAYFNGDYQKAFEAGKQVLSLEVEAKAAIEKTFEEQGYLTAYQEIVSSMEEAAQEGYVLPFDMAWRYRMVNNPEKVLEWLEKGYEIHDPNMPYIYADFADYEPINNNPRLIELLKKMKLPLH